MLYKVFIYLLFFKKMIKLYLMLRIKNIVYSSFVFLLIKFQKSFIVKKKKNNKGVFGRVV